MQDNNRNVSIQVYKRIAIQKMKLPFNINLENKVAVVIDGTGI